MEFKFNINHLFGETITMVDSRLQPHRSTGDNLKANLEKVIDDMGFASSKAQSLHGPITCSQKLRFSNHHLYIIKDAEANGGLGVAVGILKVGRKKLFVLDAHGNQIEMEPLCVLDFYVHESCQRKGCGKRLFQNMLDVERLKAQHLPIDRPSHKLMSFLMKHYKLQATVTQVNNFVIFDGFFRGQPEESFVKKRLSVISRKPPVAPHQRHNVVQSSGHRNASNAALLTHNMAVTSARRNSMDNPTTARTESSPSDEVYLPSIGRSGSAGSISCNQRTMDDGGRFAGKDPLIRGLGAQASHYSRHNILPSGTPPSPSGSASKRKSSPVTVATAQAQTPGAVGGSGVARDATPPSRRPTTFALNSHLTTQTRNGHLNLSPVATSNVPGRNLGKSPLLPGIGANNPTTTTSSTSSPITYSQGSFTNEGNYCLTQYEPTKTMHSSWNIMGIPPRHQRGRNGLGLESKEMGSKGSNGLG